MVEGTPGQRTGAITRRISALGSADTNPLPRCPIRYARRLIGRSGRAGGCSVAAGAVKLARLGELLGDLS
jgi:hypothetical protein